MINTAISADNPPVERLSAALVARRLAGWSLPTTGAGVLTFGVGILAESGRPAAAFAGCVALSPVFALLAVRAAHQVVSRAVAIPRERVTLAAAALLVSMVVIAVVGGAGYVAAGQGGPNAAVLMPGLGLMAAPSLAFWVLAPPVPTQVAVRRLLLALALVIPVGALLLAISVALSLVTLGIGLPVMFVASTFLGEWAVLWGAIGADWLDHAGPASPRHGTISWGEERIRAER